METERHEFPREKEARQDKSKRRRAQQQDKTGSRKQEREQEQGQKEQVPRPIVCCGRRQAQARLVCGVVLLDGGRWHGDSGQTDESEIVTRTRMGVH
ncbi:hypothetical protein CMUS01_10797 [Colletotrichum musicola]|uniref:Uncharacterized protein n=1 Tax=Colletotrichum musicola TaxID=2175873 RepID=A0A8H6K1T7_9PEZI|nr:hypothetical protein CMUS01_10797 [Colletotrichum musicola]